MARFSRSTNMARLRSRSVFVMRRFTYARRATVARFGIEPVSPSRLRRSGTIRNRCDHKDLGASGWARGSGPGPGRAAPRRAERSLAVSPAIPAAAGIEVPDGPARTRLIDRQRPIAVSTAAECLDGRLGLGRVRHLDQPETARLARPRPHL